MKQENMKPVMRAVVMQKHLYILAGSKVTGVTTDVDINGEITGGSEPGRARRDSGWGPRLPQPSKRLSTTLKNRDVRCASLFFCAHRDHPV